MSRFKAALLALSLGVFLGTALPAPAYADDTSFLATILSSFTSAITGLKNAIFGASQTGATATIAAAQQTNTTMTQVADANATNTDTAIRNLANSTIALNTENPSDVACQIAADNADTDARTQAKHQIMQSIAFVMAHFYSNPALSGNAIGMDKITRALCILGATGVTGECTQEAVGAIKRSVEGGHWSISLPVRYNRCIPIDENKLIAEINKLATSDTYTPDPAMQEAMAAFLSIRVNRRLTMSPLANGEAAKTQSGRDNNNRLRELVSPILAAGSRILPALAYNACFSTTMLPNCQANNAKLIEYLTSVSDDDMPPGGYCISHTQKDRAENLRDEDTIANGKIPGNQHETAFDARDIARDIRERNAAREKVMDDAEDAASKEPDDKEIAPSTRATSDNEIRELKDSIRKLTRAIERREDALPRALDVKAKTLKEKPEAENIRGPSSAAALPPLRQDFPAVP